jgi:hypothetical protein
VEGAEQVSIDGAAAGSAVSFMTVSAMGWRARAASGSPNAVIAPEERPVSAEVLLCWYSKLLKSNELPAGNAQPTDAIRQTPGVPPFTRSRAAHPDGRDTPGMDMPSAAGYQPRRDVLRTLQSMFWTAQGWRRSGPGEPPLPLPEETRAAVEAGVMFDPPLWTTDHDEVVHAARRAANAVDAVEVGKAFSVSLGNRRLDLRSALGSYAIGRLLPAHALDPDQDGRCRVCGLHAEPMPLPSDARRNDLPAIPEGDFSMPAPSTEGRESLPGLSGARGPRSDDRTK